MPGKPHASILTFPGASCSLIAGQMGSDVITTEPFDPHAATPDVWAAFHAFRQARSRAEDPGEPNLPDADFEHDARRQWPFWKASRILALHDGMIVGNIGLSIRREETEDYAAFAPFVTVWGGVLPSWRRQGVATALLHSLLAFMEQHGKATATFHAQSSEGHAFLTAFGAMRKQLEVENRLDFAGLDWTELTRWEAAAAPGLKWEVHAGRVPLERLAALIPSFTSLIADAPTGDVDRPPSRYNLKGYVAGYEEADRSGGEHLLVRLLDGSDVAGMCEGWWDARFPDRVSQYLTAVARPWRGRGLAKALKARMFSLVRERQPGVAMMSTYNAVSNAPMLSINMRLGFIRHKEIGTYQIGRDKLAAWLLTRTPRHGG